MVWTRKVNTTLIFCCNNLDAISVYMGIFLKIYKTLWNILSYLFWQGKKSEYRIEQQEEN